MRSLFQTKSERLMIVAAIILASLLWWAFVYRPGSMFLSIGSKEYAASPSEASAISTQVTPSVQPLAIAFEDPSANVNRFFVKKLYQRLDVVDSFPGFKAIHQQQLEILNNGGYPKFVMFRCDEPTQPCGGLGDRLNGVISAFYMSLLTNRGFMVRWTKGITWTHFVRPHEINWYTPESKIHFLSTTDVVSVDGYQSIEQMLLTENLSEKFASYNIVRVATNSMWADVMLKNPHFEENVKRYRLDELNERGLLDQAALTYLIRPTSLLEGVFEHFAVTLLDHGHQLESLLVIGLQVRTGGDGDWVDASRVPQEKVLVFAEAAIQLANSPMDQVFAQDSKGPDGLLPLFFVSSDSQKAVQTVQSELNFHNLTTVTLDGLAGPITHMDRSNDLGAIERNLRTWADWFILLISDKIVMSRSGYAESASAIICKPAVYFGPPYKFEIETASQFQKGFCLKKSDQRVAQSTGKQ